MSLILGAMGGAGEAMQKMGAANQDAQNKQDLATLESDLATKRAEALELYKTNLTTTTANQQRDAQTARIGAAQQGIVGKAIDGKYASSDAAVAAAAGGASPDVSAADGNDLVQAALTPEQTGVINQAKDADRQKMMDDKGTFVQAAMQTGDIAPKDILAASNKEEVAGIRSQAMQAVQDAKNDVWREKIDFMTKKSANDNNTRMLIAAMRGMGGGKDGGDTAKIKTAETYLSTVNAERKASGADPMTFEEAYSISNYAPKASQEDGIRARVATTLIGADARLIKDPDALGKAVTATMNAIQGGTAAPAAPKPAAAASAPAKRPPLSDFLKK